MDADPTVANEFICSNGTEPKLVSVDFFTVTTLTGRVLFVFIVLLHHRRRVVHINVTEHPTAAWTAQQLVNAFPDDTAPRWLLRDRDSIYGDVFRRRVRSMGFDEVQTSRMSPWQNPYVERLIGSIRRECLDHVIVLNERHLRRLLSAHLTYYHRARTHLSLEKDAPTPRPRCSRELTHFCSPRLTQSRNTIRNSESLESSWSQG